MGSMQFEEEREGKKIPISIKLDFTIIHTPPREEDDAETHQMMWRKFDFNYYSQ
jgi:hypothetical protein